MDLERGMPRFVPHPPWRRLCPSFDSLVPNFASRLHRSDADGLGFNCEALRRPRRVSKLLAQVPRRLV